MVSVCIPTFNGEKYLVECLESVIQQTWKDMEIIISDDGSDDSSCEIVRRYMKQDSRIKLFTNKN
jgi:glycosyltransferase involved in cell wall biosynthesis